MPLAIMLAVSIYNSLTFSLNLLLNKIMLNVNMLRPLVIL